MPTAVPLTLPAHPAIIDPNRLGPAMPPMPKSLEVWTREVPMRMKFETSITGRHVAVGFLVRLELAGGTVGWGGGIPRSYVTGETDESVVRTIREVYAARLTAADPLLTEPIEEGGVVHNAAWGACELAWLDAVGTYRGVRAADLLAGRFGLKPRRRIRSISAAIGLGPVEKVRRRLRMMRAFGFRDYKLKVGPDADRDEAALAECHRQLALGRRPARGPTRRTLRVDANGAWDLETAVARGPVLARYGAAAVEQPLAPGDEAALAELRRRTTVPVMLDESLLTPAGAERLVQGGQVDVFNIRITKNGGLVQSLKLALLAERHGLVYQLGCLVGETGVLSAAGRVFLELLGDRVRYAEGSYGRFLLKTDVTRQDTTFGYGGRVGALPGPGLGVTVSPEKLDRVGRRVLRLEY